MRHDAVKFYKATDTTTHWRVTGYAASRLQEPGIPPAVCGWGPWRQQVEQADRGVGQPAVSKAPLALASPKLDAGTATRRLDDFDREVYCLLGLPIDAVDLDGALGRVREAGERRTPCFLSTPNLNFLVGGQSDAAFRESIVNSDLSVVDGLPLAWTARRLGIPIRQRVTGSGLFEALWRGEGEPAKPLSVYFFGGPDGAAAAACQSTNARSGGLRCAGFQSPGFGGVEELSSAAAIAQINASGADFLVVSLSARKGQAWIERNRDRITVPVISHLGAVVNFVAGTVRRAPGWMQRLGLEWLWRIVQEPALWRRYGQDGLGMLRLLATRLLPYALWLRLSWSGVTRRAKGHELCLEADGDGYRLTLGGAMPDRVPAELRQVLRTAARHRARLVVDCATADYLSPGFFGLLLMLRKHQRAAGQPLQFTGISPGLRRQFVWNGVDYLLDTTATHALGAAPECLEIRRATRL